MNLGIDVMGLNMSNLDIIIPVKNEEGNILALVQRISQAMKLGNLSYKMIFIDDNSSDKTVSSLEILKKIYPIEIHPKKGKPGKAYSIIEGVDYATSDNIAMIDADLQYPPEVLPQMLKQLADSGVVIARRKTAQGSKLRRFVSKAFTNVFGRLLHNLNVDVQSGLKVFKKEVIEKIDPKKITPWTLDLSLVLVARDLGLGISEVDIEFDKRKNGNSKVSLVRTSIEIGKNALKLKFFRKRQFTIKPTKENSMIGGGIILKGKKYITHTTLEDKHLALKTFSTTQKFIIGSLVTTAIVGLITNPLAAILTIVAILSVIYFIDVVFNISVVLKSLHFPPEIKIPSEDIEAVDDSKLPTYTILCPLYREADVLPQFLESIEKLDWPKSKLDVILLLEEDDKETVAEISKKRLPYYVRALITPDSQPKTKPKACNYGLAHANGEYLVIYDAEDRPDPDQLKKAYLGFKNSGSKIVCLQAKLNYFNPHQNLLTRFFTAEYSLWFDVMLPGLQSINTVIPLGGTSNHFRTKTLHELEGWDPFNVTEDCDLGVRIFKKGWSTAIIDSITLEEANSNWANWIRQRSRWLKGYMQTYLVHMRNPFSFIAQNGWHAFVFQLIIGARISFMLINPILWLTTISYFALYAYVGPAIEEIFPSVIFYMAVFSLLVGNFSYIYNYMIGALKREHYSLIKFIFLIPIYWLVASYAAGVAAYQLIVKPHYWEKTVHGLHIKKMTIESIKEEILPTLTADLIKPSDGRMSFYKKLSLPKALIPSAIYTLATFISGILNLGFNVFLGRVISFENLATLSLVSSFLYFSSVPQNSLLSTITHKVGYLEGKGKLTSALHFFKQATNRSLLISFIASAAWLFSIPFLMDYFQSDDIFPFLLFTPVWTLGTVFALMKGFLVGRLMLARVGFILFAETVFKFSIALIFIYFNLSHWAFVALPGSIVLSAILIILISGKLLKVPENAPQLKNEFSFPLKFYSASALSILAPIAFLSMDVLLAKHYLAPVEAGKYALLSVIGKIIFFMGALANQLVLPLVSRNEGAGRSSEKFLGWVFIGTFLVTSLGFIFWGLLGGYTVPLVFGEKANEITQFLEIFTFTMICFSLSRVLVSYFLAKKVYTFPIVSSLIVILQFALIYFNHSDLGSIVFDMFLVGVIDLLAMAILYLFLPYVKIFENNVSDLFGLFTRSLPFSKAEANKKVRILIFNWRDISHVWSGGAENYIHELAKLWVEQGYQVTIFSGNDNLSKRYEVLDGVQIVRRGGFYTVYFWAVLYYIFRFRGLYDLVIDSENGIPFFTPLYVGKAKLLLIHHIHQEVFRNHLSLPLAIFASFLEGKLMPFIYKNQKVITVSESSKQEILKLGKDVFGAIEIVNPGIHTHKFLTLKKTTNPSFLYLGRLQPYKNIEVAIKAFAQVISKYPDATLTIAGFGESLISLKKLAGQLSIEKSVIFTGRVTDERKYELLSESWVMLQPSMIEGWGITVIEANASGTPVIASNVNGLRDSVVDGRTGMLVRPKDVQMFARVMTDLIENKEFRDYLSAQGIKWSQNFSWKKQAEKYTHIIEETLSDHTKKGINLTKSWSLNFRK